MTGSLSHTYQSFHYKCAVSPVCLYTCVCVRAFPDRQHEVVYYDTFESADDITEEDAEEREERRRLQAGARQLEARRGRIIAKRSYLRNKRVRTRVVITSVHVVLAKSSFRRISRLLRCSDFAMICRSLPLFRSCRRSVCPTTPRKSRNAKASSRAPCPSNCSR